MKDASKVIKHITKTQFEGDAKPDEISKKYIFFYISHDLIFKSKELNIETQVLEIDPENEALNEELEIDKLSYVYAIGDHLQTWISHLCFHFGESDYYRLNEIL